MKFEAGVGSRLSKKQAAKYGAALFSLSKKFGSITPALVVENAVEQNSPLHDFFDWDNDVAAEKWRLQQAGYLLRSIVITDCERVDGTVHAFFSVKEDPESQERVYVSVNRVLNEAELREQVIQYAYDELRSWMERYEKYKEFRNIVSVIKKFKQKKPLRK